MTVATEDEKTIEEDNGGVPISGRRVPLNLTKLRLGLEVERLIYDPHNLALQGAAI